MLLIYLFVIINSFKMGLNGSRVIQIKNVEDHLEQCESLGRKRTQSHIQVAPSTDSSSVSGIRAWSSISGKASTHKLPIQCQFTI